MMRLQSLLMILVLFFAGQTLGEDLTVVGFNVESGGADPDVVSTFVSQVPADLWGFSEVLDSSWAVKFEAAAEQATGGDFSRILGTTGGSDRLLILYNSDRFDEVQHFELTDINIGGNVRAPLVVELHPKAGGQNLLFMVNHLYRSNATHRHDQATMLNEWAATQTLPIITVGDFNFDWNLPNGETSHDEGFDNLTSNGVFVWVRPQTLIKSQCSQSFNSVLDFVFLAGPAKSWPASSDILFQDLSYCTQASVRSDHRPVRGFLQLAQGPTPTPTSTTTVPTTGPAATNLIGNPGFEDGNVEWTASAEVISSAALVHSGTTAAWLGGTGSQHIDTLRQTVTIPSANSATLSFWINIATLEFKPQEFDKLDVQLLSPSGQVLANLAHFSNRDAAAGFKHQSFDVSAFAGQTVQVQFKAREDRRLLTSFFVDDVWLVTQ